MNTSFRLVILDRFDSINPLIPLSMIPLRCAHCNCNFGCFVQLLQQTFIQSYKSNDFKLSMAVPHRVLCEKSQSHHNCHNLWQFCDFFQISFFLTRFQGIGKQKGLVLGSLCRHCMAFQTCCLCYKCIIHGHMFISVLQTSNLRPNVCIHILLLRYKIGLMFSHKLLTFFMDKIVE